MATREQIEAALDGLPESEFDPVLEFIVSRGVNGGGGEAAKPGDIIDDWGNFSAMKRAATSRLMRRMDEEEIAAHGETIGETFARAERENQR
jgi:hypothetical protein